MSSEEGILKFLKVAQEYCERYPSLRLEYAAGLTVFDPVLDRGIAEEYAKLLARLSRRHTVYEKCSEKCPDNEILQEKFERMNSRYRQLQRNLQMVLGHDLDPNDPATLRVTIKRLELFLSA